MDCAFNSIEDSYSMSLDEILKISNVPVKRIQDIFCNKIVSVDKNSFYYIYTTREYSDIITSIKIPSKEAVKFRYSSFTHDTVTEKNVEKYYNHNLCSVSNRSIIHGVSGNETWHELSHGSIDCRFAHEVKCNVDKPTLLMPSIESMPDDKNSIEFVGTVDNSGIVRNNITNELLIGKLHRNDSTNSKLRTIAILMAIPLIIVGAMCVLAYVVLIVGQYLKL